MASEDLTKLVVSLEANLKQYERELARAQKVTVSQLRKIEGDAAKSMSRVEGSFAKAGSAIAGFGKGLVIGGIFAAVAGLEQLVAGSISSAAKIGDLADKLGITTDKLQELQYGAVQANLSFEGLETGLLKFNKALAQAQNGSGDLLKTLEANGFSKAQIKALSYAQALDVVADLIKNAKSEQDAFFITTQAFGKGSDEFAEFLRNGSAGLQGFGNAAHDAGAVIDEELIASAQRFDDAWAAALLRTKSKLGEFVLETTSVFEKLSNAFSTRAPTNMFEAMRFLKTGSATAPVGAPASSALTESGPGKGSLGATKLFDPEVDAAATKAAADFAREKKRQAEAIERVIKALELEGINLGKSNVQQEVATALARADVDAKSEQGQKIIALVEANERHKAAIETTAFAAEQAAQKQEDFADSLQSLGEAGVSAFEQWAIEGDKLSDVVNNLAKSLLQAAVQASLFGSGPLAGLFGTSSGGGLFANLFNTPKLYAKGGRIGSGEVGIAGDGGRPELIQGPANVIPISKLGGGGSQVQIIDQRTNAPPVQKQQGADGSLRFFIRDAVLETIGSGKANKVMQGQYGAQPVKARR